ncbi:MAG: sigma-70 family RNA polymerase sigma factor [Candidatus Poribacteria bacterium]|nr:sigma-70 family RNA polymerase sigma factor [Candidatus Poribacteria bacterium]
MQNNDSELIQRTLDGDQTAFTALVEKYQKGIHALAWRKIGDFHIAQEITQDAFLRAYQRLRTLKDHSLFPGWVYVIASHLCTEWHRKKKLPVQSLETTDVAEIDQVSHSQYIAEKRDTETAEARREVVQKLLQKLPESERTVMALHYLGEMTCETISKMLGVSPNTIKSRLNRARNRLRKEEAIISENLSSFQLPTHLTQDIMKEVARVNPIVPSGSKPFVPWMVSAASAILILLFIGIGVQHLLLSFQPYDLDSESVLTVEIVDTPVSVAQKIKPDSRNQLGTTDISSKSQGTGEKVDTSQNVNFTNVIPTTETELPLSTERWTQLDSPGAVKVSTLFATKINDLFAITPIGLYRMTTDNQRWHLINSNLPAMHPIMPIPITEQGGTLYIVADEAVIASEDKGKTWKPLGTRPKGRAMGLIVKDNAQDSTELYLALLQGVFRSEDAGISWTPLNNGLARRKIYALTSVENALFAGTNRGLFRLNLEPSSKEGFDRSDVWEQLPVAESKSIHAFAVAGHRLYVVAGLLKISADMKNFMDFGTTVKVMLSKKSLWSVFRSTDRGNSWTDITPTNVIQNEYVVIMDKIVAKEKTVMLLIAPTSNTVRSTDEGKTWITAPLVKLINPSFVAALKVQSSNESSHQQQSTDVKYQFYIGDNYGIRRSTDGGNSWKRFNTGLGGNIQNLTVFKNKLYAVADEKLITSTDGGQSWEAIPVELSGMNMTIMNTEVPLTKASIREMTEADDILYAKGYAGLELIFFYLNEENRVLLPIQGVPTLGERNPIEAFMKAAQTSMEDDVENASNFIKNFLSIGTDIYGGFAVSGNTFYVEYKRKLLIWHSESQVNNDASWYDTKIADTRDMADITSLNSFNSFNSFKFGVSGDTVYVGKPDGILLHSVDRGKNWKTVPLPIFVNFFKQILITDETVYIATDKAALSSSDGAKWNIITDLDGQKLMIDRFALDDTTLYAVSSSKNAQGGVYRLTTNATWERITPEIPDDATSIAVANGILYVGTENSGLQLIGLENSSHAPLMKAPN